jgi:uncharacterized OB-fold protein
MPEPIELVPKDCPTCGYRVAHHMEICKTCRDRRNWVFQMDKENEKEDKKEN